MNSFTIELDKSQLLMAARAADAVGMTINEWLEKEISEKLFRKVGSPSISMLSGLPTRIGGPSKNTFLPK